jgi:hypothetical protein
VTACRRAALLLLAGSLATGLLAVIAAWQRWPVPPHALGLVSGLAGFGLLLALVLWFSPGRFQDAATPALTRRYYREFVPPMVLYFVVMMGWKPLLRAIDATALRVVVALLPALLMALVIRAVARYVRDSDEMQRRIELESIGLAAGVVSTVYMSAGFLQSARLIAVGATAAMLWVFPLLCIGYGLAKAFIASRYQ